MLYLSKSKYCNLWQCPKMLWLNKYKPEEKPPIDAETQARFDAGNEVGDFAMGLFGDFVEVTTYKEDDPEALDLNRMMERTCEEMEKGTPVICEASFSYEGLYCAVDILRKEGGGWAIYEVKSSTHADKPVYIADVSYQKYVLEHCGVNVTGTYIVVINNQYIRGKELDIHGLFTVKDVGDLVAGEYENVEPNLQLAEKVMASKKEPEMSISGHCIDPYECAFWNYCVGDLPDPSVFNLYRIRFKNALDYYNRGMADFQTLYDSGEIDNAIQIMQIEHALNDLPAHIDKEGIRTFLDTLSYPLYFLDFETMQLTVPQYEGTKPYQQIPFQYSLHYIEEEGGELKHKEFLAESGQDPRRAIAESLCQDIPEDARVMAYNASFEKTAIKKLGDDFPDLQEKLLKIRNNIVDLLPPFQSGFYYNRAMGGSFSIKSVLPAVFPDDPELDYHNLEDIQNGGDAMTIFPKIQYMESEEAERTRKNLLKYCELDTYAMVKLWQELVRVSG